MRKRSYKLLFLFFVVLGLSAGGLFFFAKNNAAAVNGWDDQVNSASISPNWGSIYLEISKPQPPNNTLNAPNAYAKLSYDSPTGNHFRIEDFCMYNGSSVDYGTATGYVQGDCNNWGKNAILARVCVLDANEAPTNNCMDVSSTNESIWAGVGWSSHIPIHPTGIRSNYNGKFNYYIQISFQNHAAVDPGNINAFRVEASWGKAGFYAHNRPNVLGAGLPVAVQNRNKSQSYAGTPHEDNLSFNFQVACNHQGSSFSLRWFDADVNTYDPNIYWTLRNHTTGQEIAVGPPPGGQGWRDGEEGSYTVNNAQFSFGPGHQITWTWRNVQANNGVVMWMPFDDTVVSPPECFDGSATDGEAICQPTGSLRGWALNWGNRRQKPEIHVYMDGPAGTGQGAPFPPGSYTVQKRPDVVQVLGLHYPDGYDEYGYIISNAALRGVFPQLNDMSNHTAYVYAVFPGYGSKLLGTVNFGPCAQPACGPVTVTPAALEPGQTFSLTASYTQGPSNYTQAVINVVSGVETGPTTSKLSIPPFPIVISNGSNSRATVNNVSLAAAGQYTARVRFSWSGGNIVCNSVFIVSTKPYLRVYGNDVMAGGRFATGLICPGSPSKNNATILTYDKVSGSTYTGAGSQFAASALGTIQNFSSAGVRNGLAAPTPRHGLTLGNASIGNTRVGVGNYGGNSGLWRCMPDYFGTRPSSSSGTTNVYNANTTISTTLRTVADGVKRAIYVNGDAYITGNTNIMFANTSWANVDSIPSFYLIVRGNIFINKDITRLDGIYIAQPREDGTGGTIYTCTNNSSRYTTLTQIANNCGNKLTINGAFIAKHVKFLRTNGTIGSAAVNEGASHSNIAEVFNFSPETYLATPPATLRRTSEASSGPDYDAITSLPPVL